MDNRIFYVIPFALAVGIWAKLSRGRTFLFWFFTSMFITPLLGWAILVGLKNKKIISNDPGLETAVYSEEEGHISKTAWYAEGARNGSPKAMNALKELARQGSASALYALCKMYWLGIGVRTDQSLALRYLKESAELGYAEAQYILGLSYEKGDNVPKDLKKARVLYIKAAEQNYGDAQLILGRIYTKGVGGVVDYVEAVKWLMLCFRNAPAELKLKIEEALKEKATPEQIAEGKKRAEEWLEDFGKKQNSVSNK